LLVFLLDRCLTSDDDDPDIYKKEETRTGKKWEKTQTQPYLFRLNINSANERPWLSLKQSLMHVSFITPVECV
jgi:hypothetical protein